MPEKPRPPRPDRPGSYSDLRVRPEVVRPGSRKDSPPPFSAPPPFSEPTTKAERDAAELRARLADARDRELEQQAVIDRQSRELQSYKKIDDESETSPSMRKRANVIASVLRAFGLPTGVAGALALGVLSYIKPSAKPEQIEELKTETAEKRTRQVKRESVESSYDTQLRAAYECRFAQIAFIASRHGYEVEWKSDVVFEANQIVRDKDGFQVEKPPFRPRDKCPPLPERPTK